MASIIENVTRLLNAVGMDDHGDGLIVTDVLTGYAEPGYGSDDSVVVLGNWNPRSRDAEGNRVEDPFQSTDKYVTMPSRLADALERVGAEIEWSDEWTQCQECYRAVRTSGDSYMWKPSCVYLEDTGTVCADCLIGYGEDAIVGYPDHYRGMRDGYVNDSSKVITWCEPSHVESFGFQKWEPGNPQTYESGWHPGQTDDPREILAEILGQHPTAEVIFFLDESSQFYVRFSAYFRIPAATDQED
jgi:hypothetical protein